MGPVIGRAVIGNCLMHALRMRGSRLASDGAMRGCWVTWMRLISRTLFGDSRISLAVRRWSLVSVQRLNGKISEACQGPAKKQRVGQGAPPTPTLRFSSVSSTPTVPDFTPVHPARRQGVSSTQPRLAAPAFLAQTTPRLPASLLAPRYSHLLEEAKSLSKQESPEPGTPDGSPTPLTPTDDELVPGMESHMKRDQTVREVPLTPSVGSRVKDFYSLTFLLSRRRHRRGRTTSPLAPAFHFLHQNCWRSRVVR
ncbi:hypothetical protein BJV77DRAFT_523042 [Russula vinacea]|nr:hypothetical protein BJV77DRAFT_523042 [Russula vinacea]